MIRDVQFGLLLAAAIALALGQRILPRYADQSQGAPTTAEASPEPLLAGDAKPAARTPEAKAPDAKKKANFLTTIFPDGYKDKKGTKTKAQTGGESELTPPTLPDGDLAQVPDIGAAPAPAPGASADGPVLPPDELTPPSDGNRAASDPIEKSAPEPGARSKPGRDDDEIVTEFIPFTEPEPADSKSKAKSGAEQKATQRVAPDVPSRQAMVAPNPFPKPTSLPHATPPGKRDPVLFPGHKGGIRADAGGTGPADSAAEDRPAIVQSFDIEDTGAKETKNPDVRLAKRGKPVHPFFERYLDRKTYYTRAGDTLESIALSLYQDPAMADGLLKANAEQLRSAADLRPGMILRLP